ncbi:MULTISPECIES: hypothetical protein [unclassified Streptococcus]|uniref:hypothetical protein n=1 Tax=unclassified Streptococcus TaxID=2608887 RepID=UPI0015623DAC|nr:MULTISPECIES: hypothetical protein [unclassified Streptococcus]MBW8105823.1 hypothetical protein [Streptococcus pseudopneumoniae]MBW8106199.1 hypothetical protein [Streptococcus pseudopneumoniae]
MSPFCVSVGICDAVVGHQWSFLKVILFENLFKPRQRRLAVYMLLTSSVLSTTSKQFFEQPAASFLVCSLIFIEYKVLPGLAALTEK